MDVHVQTAGEFIVYSLSEYAVTLDFGGGISSDTLQRINRFDALLHSKPFDGFRTTVAAYASLTVYFDPVAVIRSASLHGINCVERITSYLKKLEDLLEDIPPLEKATIAIPVCYGDTYGLDLGEVARYHGLTLEEVILLHSAAIYRVHLIGFVPGFAYLGGMDERLAMPRKPVPRTVVPSGSVGIAGIQTGIYPLDIPGGWQIIGRTPLRLFDPRRPEPAMLKAGDNVVFRAITPREFDSYR